MDRKSGFRTGAVANYLLDLADKQLNPLTPMKLQKLLYFSHGWHLALTECPLLDEQIESWKWGPVVSSVYHEFKEFGSGPIREARFTRFGTSRTLTGTQLYLIPMRLDERSGETEKAEAVIERVWEIYKDYSAAQLSAMTHQPDTPWRQVWEGMKNVKIKGMDIPDDIIEKHFKTLASHEVHRG